MLSERCSEPNALLEAVIKATHRRGQTRPSDIIAAWWHHFQTPEHWRKAPGSSCSVVALQRACGIESLTKEEPACIDIFLNCVTGWKDRQFLLTSHEWEAAIATSKDKLGKPHTSCLLKFYDKGRESNSLCSWWQEPPLFQEQSPPAYANPGSTTI